MSFISSQSLQFPFSLYTHILARWLVVMFQEMLLNLYPTWCI
uniref:Uncharacterized protein n=1 Tax=Utricularia reniformis TaxID=192314 RepID=A0A1Y0B0M9_9LAMI|nr:hypothetical protein AEK19_MT0707 [Utricularia reniformis]ART30953.1 hypothetical protein AEK19_MT0707 [Utricularia reniformis]